MQHTLICSTHDWYIDQEKLEDTKGLIRIRKAKKDRQQNLNGPIYKCFIANWTMLQLYHDEHKLVFHEMLLFTNFICR